MTSSAHTLSPTSSTYRPWRHIYHWYFGLVFYVLGTLSFALSLAPGYLTVIWPPAGVGLALALRYGPRVVFSLSVAHSLCLLQMTLGFPTLQTPIGVIGSICIGTCAALQTILAAKILSRRLCPPFLMERKGELVTFLLFAALLLQIPSAWVGLQFLTKLKIYAPEEWLYHWWMWWAGDVLGVLTFFPLTLSISARPKTTWRARLYTVALPLILFHVFSAIVLNRFHESIQRSQQLSFSQHAKALTQRVEQSLKHHHKLAETFSLFFRQENPSRRSLHDVARWYKECHPDLFLLAWAPHLTDEERPAFEANLSKHHMIQQEDRQGRRSRRATASSYLPIQWVYPTDTPPKKALPGLDLLPFLGKDRKAWLNPNKNTASSYTSIYYTQKPRLPYIAILIPQFATSKTTSRPARKLRGALLAMFPIHQVLAHHIQHHRGFSVSLFESQTHKLALWSHSPQSTSIAKYKAQDQLRPIPSFYWQGPLKLHRNTWYLRFRSTPQFFPPRAHWRRGGMLLFFLAFTILFTLMVLQWAGHTSSVESAVQLRTRQLAQANHELATSSSVLAQKIQEIAESHHELAQAEKSERDTAAKLQTIFDNVIDGIVLLDEQGKIESANPSAHALFHAPPDTLINRSFSALLKISDVQASPHSSLSLENIQKLSLAAAPNLRGRCLDQTTFPLEISASTLHFEGQQMTACIVRDLSERHAVDKMKNEFISTVSHELRTPLTSILGSLRLVEGGAAGMVASDARQLLQVARRNCDRLIRLINDILDLSKIEAGQIQLRQKQLTAQQVVHQALEAVESLAIQEHIRLQSRIHTQVKFKGDLDRLVQVMTNLLSNAIKYAPKHSEVMIVVALQDNTQIRFSVTDKGIGIPEGKQALLFQRFQQLDGSSRRLKGGTGLGLAIAKSLIEQHQGNIGVQSTPGQGSTFWFELPTMGDETK